MIRPLINASLWRSFSGFCIASLLIVSACTEEGTRSADGKQKWKVGVIAPLTGPAAQYGEWVRAGLLVAEDELREAKSLPVPKLLIEDSQGQASQAVTLFNRFATVDHVNAVLVVTSGDTLAVAPLATEHRLATITGTIMPEITKQSPYLFRNSTSLELEVATMARYLAGQSPQPKVAILYIAIDAGEWAQQAFTRDYQALGGTVVSVQSYVPKTTDFRPQLTAIKASKPDVLYFLSYSEFGLAMKQARELGIRSRFAGITTIEDPKGIALAGSAAEETVYTRAAFDPTASNSTVSSFVELYKTRTGVLPDVFAATFRDNLHVLARAFAQRPKDGEGLARALIELEPFDGASGPVKFEENRDVVKPVSLMVVRDGKFMPLGLGRGNVK